MSALRKGWCPGALRPMEARDGLLVRLRLTGGILSAATAHALADLATRHGNGLFDLSARANLQMRGVREAALPALHADLRALGLLDGSGAAESVRNVIASPLAGLHDGLDIRPLVAALERRLTQDATLHALPGKFGFLINDGSRPTLADVAADVRFDWTGQAFAIGLGGTRARAVWSGRCEADELVGRAVEIARAFLICVKQNPEIRRMRDALPTPLAGEGARRAGEGNLHALRAERETGTLPDPTSTDAEATFSRTREKERPRELVGLKRLDVATPLPLVGRGKGWGSMPRLDVEREAHPEPPPLAPPHKGEGELQHRTSSCWGGAAPFGRLDAEMLHAVADVAAETPLAELRLTPWRVILIPDSSHPYAIPGFITDPADSRLSVAACPGASGCARGSTDTHADATTFAARLPPSAAVALHVAGCEKGCAKPSATAFTLVARDGRYDLVRNGRAGDAPIHRNLDLDAVQRILALEPA